MSINLLRYLPMLPSTKLMKDKIEEGHSNVPPYLQLSNSVMSGVVSGVAYSHVLYGMGLARAARKDAPNQSISHAVKSYVQKTGSQSIKEGLSECRVALGARGALAGAAVFAADQLYKKVISKE